MRFYSTLRVSNGRIEGARWTFGRWPRKDSLLFDGDDEFVQIDVSGEAKEITIAAWIEIDRLDYEMNAILNSDYGDDGDLGSCTFGVRTFTVGTRGSNEPPIVA